VDAVRLWRREIRVSLVHAADPATVPWLSSLRPVAIPTELCGPVFVQYTVRCRHSAERVSARICLQVYFEVVQRPKSSVSWNVTSYSALEVHRRFGGTYCFHLQYHRPLKTLWL
jgi:hypothetical protein